METLLDHHLATFDTWLHACFLPLNAISRPLHYLLIGTLLDQLNPKHFDWYLVSVILHGQSPPDLPYKLFVLFDVANFNIEFIRIVSKFLMDRDRAGPLWLDLYKYADLATYILGILRDK
jgi:hypothetical protein